MDEKRTIYDIAKELNLAPSTISKALNGLPGVCQEKRDMINKYVNDIGYSPTPSARALKAKKSYTIGILYSEDLNIGLEHHFFSPVLQKAKEYFEANGYELSFITAKLNGASSTYANFCRDRHINGVFVVTGNAHDLMLLDLLKLPEFKLVATDYIDPSIKTVLSNNKQGVYEMVEHFASKNVKSMGIVMGPSNQFTFKERYEYFMECCEKYNIEVASEHIVATNDFDYKDGYQCMLEMLNKSKKLPEVIFAVSDLYAMGTIRALEDKGYRVPEDVSVVGFDDIDFAKYFKPSLSTIRQDTKEIGVTAAKLLLNELNNKSSMSYNNITRIPSKFIKRESSI